MLVIAELSYALERTNAVHHRVEMRELVIARCIVVDGLSVYEPQPNVAKAAVLEGLVRFIYGECQEIRRLADIAFGDVLRVEDHDIDRDVLGLEGLAICVCERGNIGLGRRALRLCRRRAGGGRNSVGSGIWIWVVRQLLTSVQFREGMHAAAQVFDSKDGALVGEIPREHRLVPYHEEGPLPRLFDLTMP